jgi:hypothetical protein
VTYPTCPCAVPEQPAVFQPRALPGLRDQACALTAPGAVRPAAFHARNDVIATGGVVASAGELLEDLAWTSR